MEYVQGVNEVNAVITRTIKVGQTLKINPSEAFLGVEPGNIEVIAILPGILSALDVDVEGIDAEAVIRQMEEYKDVMLDLFQPGDSEYEYELTRLNEQPWILYQYTTGDKEWNVFPLEEFVDHSMIY